MNEFWHWPDHVIGKRESRRLREEHNARMNERHEAKEALSEIHSIMNGVEWSSETLDLIADVIIKAGYTIKEP